MVNPMEVDLSRDELATIEAFQTMVASGTTVQEAVTIVSTQKQRWYSFTPAVHSEIDRIIKKREDPTGHAQ